MSKISAIVAKDKNSLIGVDLKMPWHLPNDLKFFKEKTLNHPIIMGHNSFKSIGCKPLPFRPHVVVSSDPKLYYTNVVTITTIEDAIGVARTFDNDYCDTSEIFICGGGEIYKFCLENELIDQIYITEIETTVDISKFDKNSKFVKFPELDDSWKSEIIGGHYCDERNEYNMVFKLFTK